MTVTTAADAVVRTLIAEGVELVFGNPGSSEVPLLDALVDAASLRYVLTLHEGVAIAAADAYGQLARRPAAVSVHVTPGVANILGGLALARAHRAPVTVIAGQQDSRILLRRPFLASDLIGLVRDHVKWAWQANRVEDILPALRRALQVARSAPPGPTLVAIPKDLHASPEPAASGSSDELGSPFDPLSGAVKPDPTAVRRAAEVIAAARAPVILSGNGVGADGPDAIRAVVALAEAIGAPVHSEHNATVMHYPSRHRQYLGGNAHGTARVRGWLDDADVVIAVGCDLFMEDRYDARPIVPAGARIVQIDVDALEIGRLYPVAAGVTGKPSDVVPLLTDVVKGLLGEDGQRAVGERRAATEARREALDGERDEARRAAWRARPIRMPRLYAELRTAMPDDAIMVDEAVNMASYLHDFFEFREPDTLLSSKQGWLGWGFGAAIGAQFARPDRRVVAVLGDGSASYTIQALWTMGRERLPIVTVILDNGRYVAVENHQREHDGRAAATRTYPGTTLGGIDFVALARGYGVAGRFVDEPEALQSAFCDALDARRPYLVHVRIDPDDAGYRRPPIPRPDLADPG